MSQKSSAEPLKVCLLGVSLDVGNLGVRALAGSLIRLTRLCLPESQITLLYGNKTAGVRDATFEGRKIEVGVVNYRLSPRSRFRDHLFVILFTAALYRIFPINSFRDRLCIWVPWLKAFEEADFIGDIRGGDSFSDIYGFTRFLRNAAPCFVAFLMRKKLVLLPQTYGPFDLSLTRFISKFILNHSERIYARDMESLQFVRNLLGPAARNKQIQFCPDVAFMLESAAPSEIRIKPPLPAELNLPLVGINISGLLYVGGYTGKNMFGLRCEYKKFIGDLIERFLQETDAHILIVPHALVTDSSAIEPEIPVSREVWKKFSGSPHGERVHLLDGEYDQSEVKSVIGKCNFFLGSRMHACIAGLSQGIPSVGLAYSKKFEGVFESVGAGNMVLDIREKDSDQIIDECMHRFRERQAVAAVLREKVPQIQARVQESFQDMLASLSPAAPSGLQTMEQAGTQVAELAEKGY